MPLDSLIRGLLRERVTKEGVSVLSISYLWVTNSGTSCDSFPLGRVTLVFLGSPLGKMCHHFICLNICLCLIYLFEWDEKEREKNVNVGEKHELISSCRGSAWWLNWIPRNVPWSVMELAAFHVVGWCPTNWTPPVRASFHRFPTCSFLIG